MRDKIKFETNVPQTVTLQYREGKLVDGRFGEQVMFSLEGNLLMYLGLSVAQKVNMLEPAVGESFVICKRGSGQKGQPVRWDVWLSPETEKCRAAKENPDAAWTSRPTPRPPASHLPSELESQLNASLEIQKLRRANAVPIERQPPAEGSGTNGPVSLPRAVPAPLTAQSWADRLVLKTDALIDAYAACLDHADRHGNRVKPDDVRALLTTVYIAMTKNGVSNAA